LLEKTDVVASAVVSDASLDKVGSLVEQLLDCPEPGLPVLDVCCVVSVVSHDLRLRVKLHLLQQLLMWLLRDMSRSASLIIPAPVAPISFMATCVLMTVLKTSYGHDTIMER